MKTRCAVDHEKGKKERRRDGQFETSDRYHPFHRKGLAALIYLWIAMIIAGNFAIAAVKYRHKKGRFKVIDDDAQCFRFLSNFGDITIDGIAHAVFVNRRGNELTIPFAQIQRLDYGIRVDYAMLEEMLGGFSVLQLMERYRDINNWFHLSLVLQGGGKVPLYVVGQYEPRAPLSEWFFELERGLLRMAGLFRDVDKTALAVVERVQSAFARQGKSLRLV